MNSDGGLSKDKKGLVLGAYTDSANEIRFTKTAEKFDSCLGGKLKENLLVSGIKKGKSRIFYKISPEYDAVAVVGIGKKDAGINCDEDIDEKKENVRVAAAAGCKSLQEIECNKVFIEDFGDAEAAAEGATLGLWIFQDFKTKKKSIPEVDKYEVSDSDSWGEGVIKANAQNFARRLADTPSNYMTPTIFADNVKEALGEIGVKVTAHDSEWASSNKMGAFLSVARGSMEPCKFLEMEYKGGKSDDKPYVLIGKGVTFDSGGISLKPSSKMDEMRYDMAGAATVVAALQAVAKLKLPINIIGLTPLTENMPSGTATKPGDIVCAMDGTTIKVDNTDAEGRLVLADALCYAKKFSPAATIDMATLTGAMKVAVGHLLTGAFTNSKDLWKEIQKAGVTTGDRVWRFPLYKEYQSLMSEHTGCDLNNISGQSGAGACTAAGFLKTFAPEGPWMHLDIAGSAGTGGDIPYIGKGVTGRPTRTIVQLFKQLASK